MRLRTCWRKTCCRAVSVFAKVAAFSSPLSLTIESTSKMSPLSMTTRPSMYISPKRRPGSRTIAFSASASTMRIDAGFPVPSPRMTCSPEEKVTVRLPLRTRRRSKVNNAAFISHPYQTYRRVLVHERCEGSARSGLRGDAPARIGNRRGASRSGENRLGRGLTASSGRVRLLVLASPDIRQASRHRAPIHQNFH